MPSSRFVVFGPVWTGPATVIRIFRTFDGRGAAMSVSEARELAVEINLAADRAEASATAMSVAEARGIAAELNRVANQADGRRTALERWPRPALTDGD